MPSQELRRGGSARKSKGRSGQDTERTARGLIPEHPDGELVPAAYSEPYSSLSSWHHPTASPSHPELSNVRGCGVWGLPSCLGKGLHHQGTGAHFSPVPRAFLTGAVRQQGNHFHRGQPPSPFSFPFYTQLLGSRICAPGRFFSCCVPEPEQMWHCRAGAAGQGTARLSSPPEGTGFPCLIARCQRHNSPGKSQNPRNKSPD